MSDQITNRTVTVVTVGTPSGSTRTKEWEFVEVHFLRFESLPTLADVAVLSPRFVCLGREWNLELFPGGCVNSDEGYIALFLNHLSTGSIELKYEFRVRNRDGEQVAQDCERYHFEPVDSEDKDHTYCGEVDFAKRSKIVKALVKGALIVEVRMRQIVAKDTPVPPFIPDNPLCKNILKRFNEEETADVVFEVGGGSEPGRGARKKAKTSPVSFYAHHLILRDSASTLAELAKSAKGMSPIQVTDVSPDVFRIMMHYVYGGEVSEEEMKANAKELIDAADEYGVVNLKLKAEACYASSLELTADNVLDNLLYADAKNCALLKEVVVDFVVQNGKDILGKVSFNDVPGSVVTDLLTAVTRGKKKAEESGDYDTMRVSTLRRKLHEKGLDIDGSRETMIALLKGNSVS